MNTAITLGVVAAGLVYAFGAAKPKTPMPEFDSPPARGPDAPPSETEAANVDAPPGQLADSPQEVQGGANTLAPVAPPVVAPPLRKRTMYAWVPDATMTYSDAVAEYIAHGGAGGAGVSL